MNDSTTVCRNCNRLLDDSGIKKGHFIVHCGISNVVGNRVNFSHEFNNKKKEARMAKEKTEKVAKTDSAPKTPKVTMTGRVKELHDEKKAPAEISKIISKEFNIAYSESRVKGTIKYLEKQK